jgi:hypothetical protein
MFRSQTDHHQGDTIFLLTSVTKVQYYIILYYIYYILFLIMCHVCIPGTCSRRYKAEDRQFYQVHLLILSNMGDVT